LRPFYDLGPTDAGLGHYTEVSSVIRFDGCIMKYTSHNCKKYISLSCDDGQRPNRIVVITGAISVGSDLLRPTLCHTPSLAK